MTSFITLHDDNLLVIKDNIVRLVPILLLIDMMEKPNIFFYQ